MSADARDWVWEHSSSRGAARLVLLSIADRVADDQCISWASLSSLAKRTRASVSTVREAVERLLLAGELEQLDDLVGPQRSTVYRLPFAAEAVAHALREQRQEEGDTEVSDEPAAPAKLRLSALRRYGIRPREVPESPARGRKPAVPETGRSRRKPAQRRTGHRHSDVPATGTQNRQAYVRLGISASRRASGWYGPRRGPGRTTSPSTGRQHEDHLPRCLHQAGVEVPPRGSPPSSSNSSDF